LQRQNKLSAAEAATRTAINLNPQLALAYGYLGQILHSQNKLSDAIGGQPQSHRTTTPYAEHTPISATFCIASASSPTRKRHP